MTINQWCDLKNEGYYIRVQKGEFKGIKHIEYSVVKDMPNHTKSVLCNLNLAAVRRLKNMLGFTVKKIEESICWLNKPDSLDMEQSNSPIMQTFHH